MRTDYNQLFRFDINAKKIIYRDLNDWIYNKLKFLERFTVEDRNDWRAYKRMVKEIIKEGRKLLGLKTIKKTGKKKKNNYNKSRKMAIFL